jgi:hypothetical protein
MRGATDFGPRGGKATALRLLADVDTTRPRAESDTNHVRCRGAKSFVDDLGLSRGVVLSRAVHFCDLLRLSPLTRRFVRFRRTSLQCPSHHDETPSDPLPSPPSSVSSVWPTEEIEGGRRWKKEKTVLVGVVMVMVLVVFLCLPIRVVTVGC